MARSILRDLARPVQSSTSTWSRSTRPCGGRRATLPAQAGLSKLHILAISCKNPRDELLDTKALTLCELPKMTLYQCTRHTFASQWVMNGGSMEMLAKIMGHSSTSTTQHYAHLAPDFFGAKAFDMVVADLTRPAGNVVSIREVFGPSGHTMATTQHDTKEAHLA